MTQWKEVSQYTSLQTCCSHATFCSQSRKCQLSSLLELCMTIILLTLNAPIQVHVCVRPAADLGACDLGSACLCIIAVHTHQAILPCGTTNPLLPPQRPCCHAASHLKRLHVIGNDPCHTAWVCITTQARREQPYWVVQAGVHAVFCCQCTMTICL